MDCDAQDNLDMRLLIDQWGWDWYGRYWAILGKVGSLINENNLVFALRTNNGRPFPVKQLSDDLSTTVERLTNFLNFLADNRLIDENAWYKENLIYCPKLAKRADEYTKKLIKNRELLQTNSRHSPDQEEKKNKNKRERTLYYQENSQAMIISKRLFSCIKGNYAYAKLPDFQKWCKESDALMRIDGIRFEDVVQVVDFCQKDSFWKSNILSTKKLRLHFPKLFLKMKEENNGANRRPANPNSAAARATYTVKNPDEEFRNSKESIERRRRERAGLDTK
jgi:hypothetical protein